MLDEREKTSVTDPLGRATCTTVCATSVSVLGARPTITVPEFWKDDSCPNCWNRAVLRLYPLLLHADHDCSGFYDCSFSQSRSADHNLCRIFEKPCWTKEKWHVWLTFQVVCSQYPFLCTTDYRLCRNFWKDYNCPDCWNRSVLCLHPFHWSRHLNLCMNSSRR